MNLFAGPGVGAEVRRVHVVAVNHLTVPTLQQLSLCGSAGPLSGGGNDIAGDDFAILSGLTEIAHQYLDRPIPILLHGYDYPVPDGRGVLGGWGFLPGPWPQPGLFHKGHEHLIANKAILRTLNGRLPTRCCAP